MRCSDQWQASGLSDSFFATLNLVGKADLPSDGEPLELKRFQGKICNGLHSLDLRPQRADFFHSSTGTGQRLLLEDAALEDLYRTGVVCLECALFEVRDGLVMLPEYALSECETGDIGVCALPSSG